MRWASRMGKRESVNRAEARRASAESGGRPCLESLVSRVIQVIHAC